MYKYGLNYIRIRPKSQIRIVLVPPGGYYDGTRYFNEFDIEENHEHYFASWTSIQVKNNQSRSCNSGLDWKEDDCKVSKVSNKLL